MKNIKIKKLNIKKISLAIISIFTLSINVVFTSFAANIIYAPTQTQKPLSSDVLEALSEEVAGPESEVISGLTPDATHVNNETVFNIVEDNNNFYCYEGGKPVTNAWRKISKSSYMDIGASEYYPLPYIWSYFQGNGKAIKASSGNIKKVKIGDSTYAFNDIGQLLLGFFNESGEMWDDTESEDPFDLISDGNLYHADETSGELTSGWYKMKGTTSRYENKNSIWMYFMPSTFRAVRSTGANYKKQNIDGKNYAFDDNGVMLVGFEALQYNQNHGGNTNNVPYFSSDGSEAKNGFVNVNLDDELNEEIYGDIDDDEDITIYLSKNGKVYTNVIKKIGSNYYGFTDRGVVVKGLSVWSDSGFVSYIDAEATNGKNFILYGTYVDKNGSSHNLLAGQTVHYFDNKGKRITAATKLEFSDDEYTYTASNSGAHEGMNNKKYYVHGLLLKPHDDAKYGVVIVNPTKIKYTMAEICGKSYVYVVNSSGTIQSSNGSGLKDDNDNYWLMSGNQLINVYDTNVRKSNGIYQFKSTTKSGSETFINFGTKDSSNRTCITAVTPNGTRLADGAISSFQVKISNVNCLNFDIS